MTEYADEVKQLLDQLHIQKAIIGGESMGGYIALAFLQKYPASVSGFLQNILEAQPATAVASALRGMARREDTSDVLAATQLPVLIITGDQDAVILPQQSQNMHHLTKNSKLVTITHAAHLSSVEQPVVWNQAVIDMFYNMKIKKERS